MKQWLINTQAATVVMVVLLIILLAAIGDSDYQDALDQEAYYSEMVCKGLWPDYKNLGVECEDINGADVRG